MKTKNESTIANVLNVKAGDHITINRDIFTYTATVLYVTPTGKTLYCTRFDRGSCFPWEKSYDIDSVKKSKIRIKIVDCRIEQIEQKYNLNGDCEAREIIGFRYWFGKNHYDHLIERVYWNGEKWEQKAPLKEPGEIVYCPYQENCEYCLP